MRAFDFRQLDDVLAAKETLSCSGWQEGKRRVEGREAKLNEIIDALKKGRKDNGNGAKVYVCGLPGTGKTYSVSQVTRRILGEQCECKEDGVASALSEIDTVASINCMTLREHGNDIFDHILEEIQEKTRGMSKKYSQGGRCGSVKRVGGSGGLHGCGEVMLKKFLDSPVPRRGKSKALPGARKIPMTTRGRRLLLILDEIDALVTKNMSVVYSLMTLSCSVIGIANSIDLTEKLLPNLRERKLKPQVVIFPTYTKGQLIAIIKERLSKLDFQLFHPVAIELCARRMAAASGDIRRCLGAMCYAIDIAVDEGTEILEEHSAAGEKEMNPAAISVGPMAAALADSLSTPTIKAIKALSNYQQIALCAAVKHLADSAPKHDSKSDDTKDSENKKGHCASTQPPSSPSLTMGDLFANSNALCKRLGIPSTVWSDFIGVASTLADQALIREEGKGKGGQRKRQVLLRVTADDVKFALSGIRFFRDVLVDL